MEFITDRQTLDDLNITGRYKSNSIYSLFNKTITVGGGRQLEQLFLNPLIDVEAINERSKVFSFFGNLYLNLPFDSKEFENTENYLLTPTNKSRWVAGFERVKNKFLHTVVNDPTHVVLQEGLEQTIVLFHRIKTMMEKITENSENTPYHDTAMRWNNFLNAAKFQPAWEAMVDFPLSFQKMMRFDYVFRSLFYEEIRELLEEIYKIDVYIAVSTVGRERGFVYANAIEKKYRQLELKGVGHPGIAGAVTNDVTIDSEKNVFFLTGANMAGKSTLMKSIGVALYLAHMGFPVSAEHMKFSIHDGMYTSINVSDNLAKGYSHFYAEVLRVKDIAKQVASNKQLLVIFDELFKGTNVKDASDGTVAVVDAFSKRNSSYIISTHIVEAGELLKDNDRLFFKYLPTIVVGNRPTYTYTLQEGITDDRQGMMIIENENILDIIKGDNV
ncbi:MutS-related protein [Robertkochia solimangrovi]|uniref:MutS-related protein n=1 Tax=Robertkochia solimangrovi TaxID=2213046 RepID=UPI00117C1B20|nr:hypothetical protein [Robertkochia solimangrovi]TRZ42329.1 hypothetical protein DMZ48_14505 [Robertkochia solimangrovi]